MPTNILKPDLKGKNLCTIKKYITKLYELIGVDPQTPSIADTIADVEALKTWKNKIKNLTFSHVNHNGTATGDNKPTFSADANGVKFSYDCFSLNTGGMTSHDNTPIPVASYDSSNDTSTAGVMSGAQAKKLDKIGTYSHIYHSGEDEGYTQTWSANADNVYLQYYCLNPGSDNGRVKHDSTNNLAPMPVASDSLAGIITAETYRKLMVLLEDVEDPEAEETLG